MTYTGDGPAGTVYQSDGTSLLFDVSPGGGGELLVAQQQISHHYFSELVLQPLATWTITEPGVYDLTISFGWGSDDSAADDGVQVALFREARTLGGGSMIGPGALAARANDARILMGRGTRPYGPQVAVRRVRVYVQPGGNDFTISMATLDANSGQTLWDLTVESSRVRDLDIYEEQTSSILTVREDRGYLINNATIPIETPYWMDTVTGLTAVEATAAGLTGLPFVADGWAADINQMNATAASAGVVIPTGLVSEPGNDYTIIVVADSSATGSAFHNALRSSTLGGRIGLAFTTGIGTDAVGYFDGAGNQSFGDGTATLGKQLLRCEYDKSGADEVRLYKNSGLLATGAYSGVATLEDDIGVGCYPAVGSFEADAQLAFLAVYRGVLAPATSAAIETALTARYGPF